MRNQAFIDGQNLYMNTKENGWAIDHKRLRIYLREKYGVDEAYYFMGAVSDDNVDLYNSLQRAGFILTFRDHSSSMLGRKKGNVDTDIVFTIMRKIADNESFDKVVLVSGDGDYSRMVKYLVKKGRFAKLLAPNHHSVSSLYRPLTPQYVSFLDTADVRKKIEYAKRQ